MNRSQKLFDVIFVIDYLYKLQELKESCDLSNLIFLIYVNALIDDENSGKPELLGDCVLKVEGSKFTSKELDDETGLYYFGQRYYDNQTSRWMSNDPMMDGAEIGLSTYTYCQNNPLLYKDPNGLAVFNPNGDSSLNKDKFTGHGNQDSAITDFNKSEDPLVKSAPVTPSNRIKNGNGGKTISPLVQSENAAKYGVECMKFSVVNETLEEGATVKNKYDRSNIMDIIKNTDYSSEAVKNALNEVLQNAYIDVKSITGSEASDMIKDNTLSENQKLALQFTQNDYWGSRKDGRARSGFHWVGFDSFNNNILSTNDAYLGKTFSGKGNLSQIKKAIIITVYERRY
jgi:RHS repeat-associated protein